MYVESSGWQSKSAIPTMATQETSSIRGCQKEKARVCGKNPTGGSKGENS